MIPGIIITTLFFIYLYSDYKSRTCKLYIGNKVIVTGDNGRTFKAIVTYIHDNGMISVKYPGGAGSFNRWDISK